MLVLSRRENDRIDFPTLGISVEVLQLTRSRASLGIVAPKGVRIVRHELMGTSECPIPDQSACESSDPSSSDILPSELEAATKKIEHAHQQLARGESQQALKAIAEGLAELDQIRAALSFTVETQGGATPIDSELNPLEAGHTKLAPLAGFANRSRKTARAVSESTPGYRVGNQLRQEDQAVPDSQRSVVLFVQSMDESEGDLPQMVGFDGDVQTTDQPLTVLYELSRYVKPDAVLMASGLDQETRDATVEMIRSCSQHPDVRVVQMNDASQGDHFLSASKTSV